MALSVVSNLWGLDPNLKQPYVHQISFSIEREIGKDFAIEGRYVSTMGRQIWRGFDLNQTNAAVNQAFVDDFTRARTNGFLAQASTGQFNPAYNANIAGSQQLTVIPTFGGGSLTNTTVRNNILQGQIAALADFYVTSSTTAAAARKYFMPNSGIYGSNLIVNGGETDYHAFQGELRRRFSNGIFGQANYTFSKVLTNSTGLAQNRLEVFIDNNRPQLQRGRAEFDLTHVINGSMIYELPFGPGKRFLTPGGALGRIVGGWQISSIVHYQSGAPISILSTRATFNRAGNSANNPADSTLTSNQINDLLDVRKQPDGTVYYIDPKVINPADGRGVGSDNFDYAAGFAGQVFFNPRAGTIGSLQALQFDGPAQFTWDFSITKKTRITETTSFDIRGEFFNFLNHPLFYAGDQTINSTNFGKITSLNVAARVVQVSAKFSF
jgi:hypothetical protein